MDTTDHRSFYSELLLIYNIYIVENSVYEIDIKTATKMLIINKLNEIKQMIENNPIKAKINKHSTYEVCAGHVMYLKALAACYSLALVEISNKLRFGSFKRFLQSKEFQILQSKDLVSGSYNFIFT